MRIAIQGTLGAFHEFAARKWYKDQSIEFVYCDTFREVFKALQEKRADLAVVALENSLYGSINEVYDLLQHSSSTIAGEIMLHIHQQLIGLPGAPLAGIKYVYSQPVALAQCNYYITTHLPHATPVDYHDTTASVHYVKEQNDPSIAAVAGIDAAKEYGLSVIAENIEDNKQNFTRFLVIDPNGKSPANANKSSLVLTTNHTPGALAHVLSIFAKAGVNLSKLQSRPIVGDAWKYRFYVDLETAGTSLHALLSDVRQTGATIAILGEYQSGKTY